VIEFETIDFISISNPIEIVPNRFEFKKSNSEIPFRNKNDFSLFRIETNRYFRLIFDFKKIFYLNNMYFIYIQYMKNSKFIKID